MNAAVLFNAAEDGGIRADALLAGKELYRYSLKTFYFHPCIDCIAMVLDCGESTAYAEGSIENWRAGSGIDKPVRIYQGNQGLKQVLDGFEEDERHNVELYVLHDIRYPFVTQGMIYGVTEKAALHRVAVTAGEVEDSLVACSGQKALGMEGLCYAKYPAAVRAGHEMLGCLAGVAGALGKCAEYRPYLCNAADKNPFIGTQGDIEMAEVVLRMGGNVHL